MTWCEHVSNVNEDIIARTQGCEECEREGTDTVALPLCLTCGHVGCCDSSEGMHATMHFKETGHPVMIALSNKSWNWCYVHKTYL
ncbi:MAG: UBP-type zinc finger domain-containing protein [Nitrososphaerales archaeon]